MMLSLPNRYGGYGLSGAALNCPIKLNERPNWQRTNTVYADMLWKQAKLVVEYDSYQFHNSKNSWVKDARRAVSLERNGYKTVSINTAQIYDETAFTDAAHVIAHHLGKRIRIRSDAFLEQRVQIQNLLPRS